MIKKALVLAMVVGIFAAFGCGSKDDSSAAAPAATAGGTASTAGAATAGGTAATAGGTAATAGSTTTGG